MSAYRILHCSTASGNSAGSVISAGGRLFVDQGSFIFSNTFGDVSGPPVGIDIAMRDELFVSGLCSNPLLQELEMQETSSLRPRG